MGSTYIGVPVRMLRAGWRRGAFLVAINVALLPFPSAAADFTLRLDLHGRTLEGAPIAWSQQVVHLLGRDGNLWSFSPGEAENCHRTDSTFRSLSQAELRGLLLAEFGTAYDVSGTGNYLVVHPAGQRDRWAPRFEELYRSFVHYFAARGMRPRALQFPLVAVVFGTQRDFLRYAAQTGSRLGPGFAGYYSPTTNRVVMYDATHDRGDDQHWYVNAGTIIHEAAHQSAYNTGIHSRFAPPPRWITEGLGTMFEARGVWDSGHCRSQGERVNGTQLQVFRRYLPRRRPGQLAEFVSSDQLFRRDTAQFYAEAWALTFFLAENEPRKYFRLLSKTSERDPFTEYPAPEQLADFVEIFGPDLPLLEARMLRFLERLELNVR